MMLDLDTETQWGAVDDAVTCLSIQFAPINARMAELQEEFAGLEAEKTRLVTAPIPRALRGRMLE